MAVWRCRRSRTAAPIPYCSSWRDVPPPPSRPSSSVVIRVLLWMGEGVVRAAGAGPTGEADTEATPPPADAIVPPPPHAAAIVVVLGELAPGEEDVHGIYVWYVYSRFEVDSFGRAIWYYLL